MKQPNKIMEYMLRKVFRINCDSCKRHWLFEDYIYHKANGQCVVNPGADNNIATLAQVVERRQTMMGSGSSAAAQMAAAVAAQEAQPLSSIYILERDSKYVYEFKIATKQVFRRTVNIPASFQHNFAYV